MAGGHVAVLLNRLRIFGLKQLIADHPIVAWSGGAIVLGQRLILFHDNPPQGAGFAELLEGGLGLFSSILPFPDAGIRLQLEDSARLKILAHRFHPQWCLLLDPGTQAYRENNSWVFQCPFIDVEGSVNQCGGPKQESQH